jgi:hypothetical protein
MLSVSGRRDTDFTSPPAIRSMEPVIHRAAGDARNTIVITVTFH